MATKVTRLIKKYDREDIKEMNIRKRKPGFYLYFTSIWSGVEISKKAKTG